MKKVPDNYKRYALMWKELNSRLGPSMTAKQVEKMNRIYAKYETYEVNVSATEVMNLFNVSRATLMAARKKGKLESRGMVGNMHYYLLDDVISWAKNRKRK